MNALEKFISSLLFFTKRYPCQPVQICFLVLYRNDNRKYLDQLIFSESHPRLFPPVRHIAQALDLSKLRFNRGIHQPLKSVSFGNRGCFCNRRCMPQQFAFNACKVTAASIHRHNLAESARCRHHLVPSREVFAICGYSLSLCWLFVICPS